MKQIFTFSTAALLLISMWTSPVFGQLEHGGSPLGKKLDAIAPERLPAPDLRAYMEEDEYNDLDHSIPYRFGAIIETDLDNRRHGEWLDLPSGDRLWRLALQSDAAVSLNFQFDVFDIPEGGKVFVYDPSMTQVKGSFTRENVSPIGSLGMGLIFGDALVIEYLEPAAAEGQGYLHIDAVTHGYRGVMHLAQEAKSGPFGNAGLCNINVNCPEGLPYNTEKRSVAIIVVNNNGICTGALVNNTAQDNTPYFLTANHCLPSNTSNTNNWVFYFNHEAPGCTGNNGPTNQSISGGQLKASNGESDFALLELNNTPPASFDVCYSGWDATDNQATVTSAVGIHHPRGDVKKICFENDAPYHEALGIPLVNQTWFIDDWELGVTEPASSGSPLFNPVGRIIGTLSGGTAACNGTVNNGGFDFYGRFGVSWNFGNTAATRLRDWLDPGNTGVLILDNSCSSGGDPVAVVPQTITGLEGVYCDTEPLNLSVGILNIGQENVTSVGYSVILNGSTIANGEWTGTLAPSASANVNLPAFSPVNGANSLSVVLNLVNGNDNSGASGNTVSATFHAFGSSDDFNLFIDFDDYPEETTWQIADENGDILYSGGPYPNQETFSLDFCLSGFNCFEFTIFDEWSDGICCGFGEGSYQITNSLGEVVASGGEFGSEETTVICGTLSTGELAQDNGMQVYPNPAFQETRVAIAQGGSLDAFYLTDLQGKRVMELTPRQLQPGEVIEIPTSALAPGMYIITAVVDGQMFASKLMRAR